MPETIIDYITTFYDAKLDSVYVKGRQSYAYYEYAERSLPCEDCDDGPKKVFAYKIKVDDQDVYVPESMCTLTSDLPQDFDTRSFLESWHAKILDTTADALKAYEEAFGITAEMIYTPDAENWVIVKHEVNKPTVDEEDGEEEDLSGRPFIFP